MSSCPKIFRRKRLRTFNFSQSGIASGIGDSGTMASQLSLPPVGLGRAVVTYRLRAAFAPPMAGLAALESIMATKGDSGDRQLSLLLHEAGQWNENHKAETNCNGGSFFPSSSITLVHSRVSLGNCAGRVAGRASIPPRPPLHASLNNLPCVLFPFFLHPFLSQSSPTCSRSF